MIHVGLSTDDELALLVAIHYAGGSEGFVPAEQIRTALGRLRLQGDAFTRGLKQLHREGLVLPQLRGGWRLTEEGWARVVGERPSCVPDGFQHLGVGA